RVPGVVGQDTQPFRTGHWVCGRRDRQHLDAVIRPMRRPRREHLPRAREVELLGALEQRDRDARHAGMVRAHAGPASKVSGAMLRGLPDVFDDVDELVHAVALAAGELDELSGPLNARATLGCPSDADAAPAAKLEEALVTKEPQGRQDGVRVDGQHGGKILGGGKALSWLRLSLGNRAADFSRDLHVQIGWVALVHLDSQHGASNTSAIKAKEVVVTVAAPPRP